MVRPGREYEEKRDGCDRSEQPVGSEGSDESRETDGSVPLGVMDVGRSSGGSSRVLLGRIGGVLRDGAEGDLFLGSVNVENGIMQWLRALDLQVVGGCRADERLRPLLKINVSSGTAEDQFMAQLIQHFEASEIAVLARCLCLPLVSVRVGRIDKQGKILCPTATRGFLSLILLPSSHLRISFTGDDGCVERLALVSSELGDFSIAIDEISADTSGRSFLLKLPCSRMLYFWCSEKSKADGMELIMKMKDLLRKKPSLSDLTGISEARLDSFAIHLRSYLLASANIPAASSSASCCTSLITAFNLLTSQSDLSSPNKSSRICITAALAAKIHPVYQSSLSPRSNTFKDSTLKISSIRNGVREKIRRRCNSSANIQHITPSTTSHDQLTQHDSAVGENIGSQDLLLHSFPSLSSPLFSFSSMSSNPSSQVSNQISLFSPYYCTCPPFPTSLLYRHSHPPHTSESVPLPPFSTLLSAPLQPLDVIQLPSSNFPVLLPEPWVNLSCSGNSLCPLPGSQHVPTFTPFLSDPIVHIPFIDVFSSGQGYLVSSGPSISSTIPPLPIGHVSHQHLSPTDSPVEKNARETLQMLMSSKPISATSKLFTVLPEVLNSMEHCGPGASVSPML